MNEENRHVPKGELAGGMTALDLFQEAQWITQRLEEGKRVLVHCLVGFNRSATVCCAVLMLLEGLTAEEALKRVRTYHPGANPDPYHWFALLQLQELLLAHPHHHWEEVRNRDAKGHDCRRRN